MAAPIEVRHVRPEELDPDLVRRVAGLATAADGVEPLNEAALLALRDGGPSDGRFWLARSGGEQTAGFAWRHGSEIDLVVAPDSRRQGVGAALADAVAHDLGEEAATLSAWSHGNHPAAQRLARRHGWARVRDLWVMRRPLTDLPPVDEARARARESGVTVRTFRPGHDEEELLAVNAAAFAWHPEQGSLTRTDLEARMAEPWFDPEGLFVAERADERPDGESPGEADRLLGFHWTKVHDGSPGTGEVYVVGVSPEAQGTGLGRLLTLTGLHHLAGLGLPEVHLYVESDNEAAVATYARLGFTHADTDTHVMYRGPGA